MTSIHGPDSVRTREFLELARAGDSSAERRIFERFGPALLEDVRRHKLMRRLRHVTTPEDLVSEVWVRWYSSGCLFAFEDRGEGSLHRFLCRILNNVMVDEARRTGAVKRKALFGSVEQRSPSEAAGRGALEVTDHKEATPTSDARAREWLALCRETLDAREWSVWSMCEIEGFTASEIGSRFGLSASAARSILHRARMKLVVRLSSAGAVDT